MILQILNRVCGKSWFGPGGRSLTGSEADEPAPESAVRRRDHARLQSVPRRLKRRQNLPVHPDVVQTHPGAKPSRSRIVKIHQCDAPPRAQILATEAQHLRVAGIHHRKTVGKNNQVKWLSGANGRVVYTMKQGNSWSVDRQLLARLTKHLRGEIEANNLSIGEAPCELSQILARTAADLQNALGTKVFRRAPDQRRASEQVGPASEVVDLSVPAIIALQICCRGVAHCTSARSVDP